MDSYQFMFVSSFSVLIPLYTAAVYFKQIDRSFYPLIALLSFNLINEVIVWIVLGIKVIDVRFIYNLYFLIEALVISWQFKRWGLFRSIRWLFHMIVVLYFAVWICDSLYFLAGGKLNSVFIIFYSFAIILMSLAMLYLLLKEDYLQIVKHPIFISCITFLFFFVYTIITEVLSMYPNTSMRFRWNILNLLNTINILSHIGYAFAISQIKKQLRFRSTLNG